MDHLSYPSSSSSEPTTDKARHTLKDRLYIGNIHPTVDEYTLLKVFSKFGKVSKLDFLFHKTGPLKGRPRGYAFIEYGNDDDALKALTSAHDKLLRGRKLVVTYAHQAPLDNTRPRKTVTDAGKPTTLSIIKSDTARGRNGTTNKIAMMEAKLRQMEASNPRGPLRHPLPEKPPRTEARSPPPPPPLPLPIPTLPDVTPVSSTVAPKKPQTSKLAGVKIKSRPKSSK